MSKAGWRSKVSYILVTFALLLSLGIMAVPGATVKAAVEAFYNATEIQDWLISQVESTTVSYTAPTVTLNATDHYMQIDTDATVQGTTMSLNRVKLTFDNSTNVSMVGELSMLGKNPRFWADAQIECAVVDGIPQVKNISNIKIADYEPSLSADTLNDIADAANKAIETSGFTIAPLSADLTGIDIITEGGEAKLKFTCSGGSLTWTKSDIEDKLDTAASNLKSQANDYISTGYDDGKWSLNVTIGGGKLTFNAQATLFGITAKIQNMDITFSGMTASTTNATVSLGSNQATFSATADIACTDSVPSLTVTSLSLGDEYPTLRDWINDTDINAALRDGADKLVTNAVTSIGLKCRLATFDHIAVTVSDTIRIWLEAVQIQVALKSGWNMVSVPVVTENTSVSAVFPGVEAVYTWDPASKSYTIPTDIDPDKGYWALVLSDTNIAISGTPVQSWTSNITQGWNMIGSVYGLNVTFTDPDDTPDSSVEGYAYWWNPTGKSYDYTTLIEPMKGYWVIALQDCSLTVS